MTGEKGKHEQKSSRRTLVDFTEKRSIANTAVCTPTDTRLKTLKPAVDSAQEVATSVERTLSEFEKRIISELNERLDMFQNERVGENRKSKYSKKKKSARGSRVVHIRDELVPIFEKFSKDSNEPYKSILPRLARAAERCLDQ